LDVLSNAGITPRAWLLEKPVVSSEDEKVVMSEALAEIGPRVFVNENYLASKAVAIGREIIASQEAAGNPVTAITVHFVKDRVPNVILDNRFTDTKGLAVFGIEMPHQLAIASVLHGSELDTRGAEEGGSIAENTYLHDIDGIEQSEGNITVFKQDDKTIILRQGLGPFDFDTNNGLVRREYDWKTNQADRYANVDFADGSTLRLTFDPVAGAPRYHSKVEYTGRDGALMHAEVFPDNTLRNLIGAVATFAATDGRDRSPILDQLRPEPAMRYFEQLRELRSQAGEPRKVTTLGNADDSFADTYLASLRSK
jgi:predicted dehydrogenase